MIRGRRLRVELQQVAPAARAVHAGPDESGALAMPLEVAVLEIDAGHAAGLRGEPNLDLAGFGDVGFVLPPRIDLPGQDEAVRWLPRQHPAPVTLGTIGFASETPASGARFDDRFHERLLADVMGARPPCVEPFSEDVESVLGTRLHGHALLDWCFS